MDRAHALIDAEPTISPHLIRTPANGQLIGHAASNVIQNQLHCPSLACITMDDGHNNAPLTPRNGMR